MHKADEIYILIVDDEEAIRSVISLFLELEGFRVLTASSGQEAQDILRSSSIQIVLSDVRMPDGDGLSLLKYVRERFGDRVPVVLFSGFTEITEARAKELGAFEFIAKPPNMEQLVSTLRRACGT